MRLAAWDNPDRQRVSPLSPNALLECEHEALTRKAIEKALEGDMVVLRLCLERIAPARKDAPISFALSAVRSAEQAVQASAELLAAVATWQSQPSCSK